MSKWQDFNDAAPQRVNGTALPADDVDGLKAKLIDVLPSVLRMLLPDGKERGGAWLVGDAQGTPGDSLRVELRGSRTGMWHDFATGEGGDIIKLWAAATGKSTRREFPAVLADIRDWLGEAAAAPAVHRPANTSKPATDELGPVTGKWDYHDEDGRLIACVYRYDPPSGKEFRPWDVASRKMKAPDPRPLYNQPGLKQASDVVLVEGEKAADALIAAGMPATTAMNGAKAPVDKTDWSPLAGKRVLIWPDHDAPGQAYAEAAGKAALGAGAAAAAILKIPEGKAKGWDAADAAAEKINLSRFLIKAGRRNLAPPEAASLPAYSLGALLDDHSPMPEDHIGPRLLTPGGMLVLGGAPKVGKSDFLISLLVHMAAGEPFLGFRPPRPLRIFYLQAEIQYHYLRERLQNIPLDDRLLNAARDNVVATPRLSILLNEDGLERAIATIKRKFDDTPPDIICLDPIRNLFDGGPEGGGENDNAAMMFFLTKRVEALRDAVNPDAGLILCHHTRKLPRKQLAEDPFMALSGAGALRSFYTSGMVLHQAEERRPERRLETELRNGPAIAPKLIDKQFGRWVELEIDGQRLAGKGYGAKLDAERDRKRDVICQLLLEEAEKGNLYTANQFAERFENQAGLGAAKTIRERISVLSTKGHVKFLKDSKPYGKSISRSVLGYLCVKDMRFPIEEERPDPENGEVGAQLRPIWPDHYKCPQTGALLPVENARIWVTQEDAE